MNNYKEQQPLLVAVDCIIFGFDGKNLKLLLIQRGFEPEKDKWSLMGGFLQTGETLDDAANRILKNLTGLTDIYMEQLHVFSSLQRDPEERTISVSYFALINIEQYEKQISHDYYAEWFLVNTRPKLIFDHSDMVRMAHKQLSYKSSTEPILFELLPKKFTISQLQTLYEAVFEAVFDKRNFIRKLMATGLLIKTESKDKMSSRKGAFLYKINKRKFKRKQDVF